MSRRFGRNQRRKLREQLAAAQEKADRFDQLETVVRCIFFDNVTCSFKVDDVRLNEHIRMTPALRRSLHGLVGGSR